MLRQNIEVEKDPPESFTRPVDDSFIAHPGRFPIIENIDDVRPTLRQGRR
jgi:hypothetical protein